MMCDGGRPCAEAEQAQNEVWHLQRQLDTAKLELQAAQAVYRLTVKQRDDAWRALENARIPPFVGTRNGETAAPRVD